MEQSNRTGVISSVILVLIIGAVVAFISACQTVPQGEVGFVKGGGPLDPSRHKVKGDLVKPGLHITGTWDGMDTYPSNKTLRFQDFDVPITTVDGKKVQIKGQIGFRFVGEKDPALAKQFAEGLGARKYGGKKPGDGGEEGWTNFLDQLVSPEITAVFKDQFGRVYCADFEPSCRSIDPRQNIPLANPEKVYTAVSRALQARVSAKLGAPYLQNLYVQVKGVDLPTEVQSNIDRVTSEQAATQAAKQAVLTADQKAKAIAVLGDALKKNKSQIGLEIAKQCQSNDSCTLIVDGTGNGVTPSVSAGK